MLTFRIKVVGYDADGNNNPSFVVRLTKSVSAGSTNATTTATTEKPSNATAAPATNATAAPATNGTAMAEEQGMKMLKIFDIAQYGSTFEEATDFNEVRSVNKNI